MKGYQAIIAINGQQGMEMAHTHRPQLILMDMRLPLLSGWDATRQLKASDDTRSIPIIALTAHASNADRERAFAVGCDDYEPKPIAFPQLLAKIVMRLRAT